MNEQWKLVPVEPTDDMIAAAPVPPAGDVEVPSARQSFDAWFTAEFGLPAHTNTALIGEAAEPWRAWKACSSVYGAHVTRLTAERDGLRNRLERATARFSRWNGRLIESLREERAENEKLSDFGAGMQELNDHLQSELTKARELNSVAADDLHQANVRAIIAEEQLTQFQCKHEWVDDGEFNLACTVCGAQESHDPQWLDMDSAPKDGTLVRLLVEFDEHSTEDAEQAPTIGSNNFENDDEDQWTFAGWCWTHDHWVQGKGKPVGWLPMFDVHQPPIAHNVDESCGQDAEAAKGGA